MTRAALLLLLAAGCGQRYFVNEAATNVPNVFLHCVHTSGGDTEIVFRVEVDSPCDVAVAPPGDAKAFRLRAGERTFALTEVSGIGELPAKSAVDAYKSLRFTLEFDPLPEDVRKFNVEGEISGVGPVVFAVDLDAPNVVKRGW